MLISNKFNEMNIDIKNIFINIKFFKKIINFILKTEFVNYI